MKSSCNQIDSGQTPGFALDLALKLLLMLMVFQCSSVFADDVVFSDGFEAIPSYPQLDCKREGYPCSLDKTEPEKLDRAIALLTECWNVRHAGTMDDVRTYLESQTDVIDIGGNYRYISFRVEGMMPVIFDDLTTVLESPLTTKHLSKQNKKVSLEPVDDIAKPMEVVGSDSNGDGTINQKDSKRALILAPYEWQFVAPDGESGGLAIRLEALEPYAGNVVYKANSYRNDANITLGDWLAFDNYDVISVSTHGSRECLILPDLSNHCEVWISSGVVFDFLNPIAPVSIEGASISVWYADDAVETPRTGSYVLSLDFWRYYYHGALTNKLVTFSSCETGNSEGEALAAAMGGDNFVMGGWTEAVSYGVAFYASLAFYEQLATGITAREAFDYVAGLGLFPALNPAGIQTSFELFSPHGDDVRIIELPQLKFDGATMEDGTNIQELVTGVVADQSPDSLTLTLQVDGVTADTKSEFAIHYRVADQDVPGVFDLNSATLVDNNYRYEVVHEIPLGFPLAGGDTPIEVIVDLPEGGDSRFSVNTFLAGCYFTANISGDNAAFFDGPAQFEIDTQGAIQFTLRNRAKINSDLNNSIYASFSTGPSIPLTPGSYAMGGANVNIFNPFYEAYYLPGVNGADCPSCGGTVNIETFEEELSISGSANVTMLRTNPPPENNESPMVQMDINFVAAFGSQYEGSSPYVQCSILYADD